MTRYLCFLFSFSMMLSSVAHATTGNDWRKLQVSSQLAYLAGVYDMWEFMGYLTKETSPSNFIDRESHQISKCLRDKRVTYEQLRSIVEKHMGDHPKDWGLPMSGLVWHAVGSVCTESEPAH